MGIRLASWGGAGACLAVVLAAGSAQAATETDTAELLIKLLQVGRSVVSSHQDLINDPTKGDKGFTPDYVADQMIRKYRELTQN